MPTPCSICTHPQHDAIDAILTSRQESYAKVSTRFGVSKEAVARHARHMTPVARGTPGAHAGADWARLAEDAAQLHTQALAASTPLQVLLALRQMAALLVHLIDAGLKNRTPHDAAGREST